MSEQASEPIPVDPPPAGDAVQDVYVAFLGAITLTDKDRRALRERRGLSDETINTLEFRSGGEEALKALHALHALGQQYSADVLVAAGLYQPGDDEDATARPDKSLVAGPILIPYRNRAGQYTGIRRHKRGSSGKAYSPKGKQVELYMPWLTEAEDRRVLHLTEGEFKAAGLAELGYNAMAVPGISSFVDKGFGRLCTQLRQDKVERLILVYDAEDKSNPDAKNYKHDPNVRYDTPYYAFRMAWQLERALNPAQLKGGFQAWIATLPLDWDPEGVKVDCDSALAAGKNRTDFDAVFSQALRPVDYLRAPTSVTRLDNAALTAITAKLGRWLCSRRNDGSTTFQARRCAEILVCLRHWFCRASSDGTPTLLYVYADGVYRARGRAAVDQLSLRLLRDHWKPRWRDEVANALAALVVLSLDEEARIDAGHFGDEEPLPSWINVENGWVNWRTGESRPHTPDELSTVQLPMAFDPEADAHEARAFLMAVLPKDFLEDIHQVIGYLLVPTTAYEKAFLLVGSQGTGKTTFLTMLTALLGDENVSTASLHTLCDDRFGVASIVDRLANMGDDLPSTKLEDSSRFKKIVSGARMDVEQKYRDSYSYRPTARLLFSTNTFPENRDTDEAWFTRWLLIPFPNQFRGTKSQIPEPELIRLLTTPQQLSGLLNLAMQGLRELADNGGFKEPDSAVHAKDRMREESDTPGGFIRERCKVARHLTPDDLKADRLLGAHYQVGKTRLFEAYAGSTEPYTQGWCHWAGVDPVSRREFYAFVRRLPGVTEGRGTESDGSSLKSHRIWSGIRLEDVT
jgi:P4 family phage/plasmid primase-like protien